MQAVHGRRYRIGLLITALAIIGFGVALRPQPKREPQPLSDIEMVRLQRLTQERRLTDLSSYISWAAQNAAKALLYVPELGQTAVAVDISTVATGVGRVLHPSVKGVSPAGDIFELHVQSFRPEVPVQLMHAANNILLTAPARARPDTGEWVLAVALRRAGDPVFGYGLFQSSSESRCGAKGYTQMHSSVPLTRAFTGGGLFTLRGELIGIIARCESEMVVLSTESVAAALSGPVSPNEWLQDRYGFRVSSGAGSPPAVVSVWSNTPAATARLTPGDELISVDAKAVDTDADLVKLLTSSDRHALVLRRGRTQLRTTLSAPIAPEEVPVPQLGMNLIDSPRGIIIRSITAGGAADRAGVLSGDRIVHTRNIGVMSAASIANVSAKSGGAILLTLERDNSQFEVQLTP